MEFKESGQDGPPLEQPDPSMEFDNLTPTEQKRVEELESRGFSRGDAILSVVKGISPEELRPKE